MPISVSIVEDNDQLRGTLARVLNRADGFSCVSHYANAEDALKDLPQVKPDVVLMDINLPGMNGVECVRQLKKLLPETQIMMLTVYEDTENIFNALTAGANGYMLKRTPSKELLEAIPEVHRGGSPMTMHIARKVVQSLQKTAPAQPTENLSEREQQVLDLLSQGLMYKEIAEKLGISYEPSTPTSAASTKNCRCGRGRKRWRSFYGDENEFMRGLPRQVRMALEKATDSALLAVEVYNKPAVKFKSGAYICLMVIAWTSLFQAIFFRKRIKPFYRMPSKRFERVDGDFKYWELDECLRQHYGTDTENPVRKNLGFFIPLRNKIEHRSMPELDSSIFGECQALLLNFDELLEKEFGTRYCIRECLSFSLQLFPSAQSLVEAVKRNPPSKPIVEFVQRYRSTVSPEIQASGKYAFKAFLIQVANHQSENATPIQFVL